MKPKQIIGKLLMAFVLVSIGFAAGKEMTRRSMMTQANTDSRKLVADSSEENREESNRVIVYYLHTTFRCATCNSIESMAKKVVEEDFADALADGSLEWRTVNFQEKPQLARRYGVGASTLVIVKQQEGREVDFKRLDEVWTHISNPAAFRRIVDENIKAYLNGDSP